MGLPPGEIAPGAAGPGPAPPGGGTARGAPGARRRPPMGWPAPRARAGWLAREYRLPRAGLWCRGRGLLRVTRGWTTP
jgi:hypothetical protein